MMAIITACKMGVIEASPAGVISNNGDSGGIIKSETVRYPMLPPKYENSAGA